MGKRIRWIWVISLAAALAAIGVQGYWLFNQFRYEMCTYADEIAGEVFHAGQEEFRIRKEEAEMTKGTYIIERQSKYQSGVKRVEKLVRFPALSQGYDKDP